MFDSQVLYTCFLSVDFECPWFLLFVNKGFVPRLTWSADDMQPFFAAFQPLLESVDSGQSKCIPIRVAAPDEAFLQRPVSPNIPSSGGCADADARALALVSVPPKHLTRCICLEQF